MLTHPCRQEHIVNLAEFARTDLLDPVLSTFKPPRQADLHNPIVLIRAMAFFYNYYHWEKRSGETNDQTNNKIPI